MSVMQGKGTGSRQLPRSHQGGRHARTTHAPQLLCSCHMPHVLAAVRQVIAATRVQFGDPTCALPQRIMLQQPSRRRSIAAAAVVAAVTASARRHPWASSRTCRQRQQLARASRTMSGRMAQHTARSSQCSSTVAVPETCTRPRAFPQLRHWSLLLRCCCDHSTAPSGGGLRCCSVQWRPAAGGTH